MKRTPDPKQVRAYRRGFKDALAKMLALMSDVTRQLPKVPVVAPSVKPSSRVRNLEEALARSKEELALSHAHAKAAGDEVVRLHGYHKLSDERRLELVVLAHELGCDCVPHKMLEAVKALKTPIRQRASRGGGVDEHGNRFEFDADESGACTAFAFNGVKYANEVNHKVYATLSDGTRVCRVIRTGDSWTAIHKALTTPEDGDNKSEKLPTKKPRQAISVTEEWTPAFRKLADAARDSGRKVKR